MNPQQARSQRIRVALFVLGTIGLIIASIVVLGHAERLFARKVTLHATFDNTAGLTSGAAVRLAGVAIGIVTNIKFDKDIGTKHIDVDLAVDKRYLDRIRADSVAQINSKGLLGDMIVDVTLGSADKPALKNGDHLNSVETSGLAQVITQVEVAIKKVDGLVGDVDSRLQALVTPQVTEDFGHLFHSAAAVMDGVEHGGGLVHDLIYKPALADSTGQLLKNLQLVAAHANASLLQIQEFLTDARTGDGLLHAVVYDKQGGKVVAQLQTVTADLSSVMDEVKTGHGLVHSLIYEKDKTNLLENLGEAARLVRRMAEETDQGKGTIGGLLKDPTVYEDLTTVLGNIKRNELLKALIRYTIVQDDQHPRGRVEPVPVSATP